MRPTWRNHCCRLGTLAIFLIASYLFGESAWVSAAAAQSAEPQWIWSPAREKEKVPAESCYFRKSFEMGRVAEDGVIEITCDDAYELYVNGRQVATGNNWKLLDSHDITKFLVPGRNIVAVKATNSKEGSAGLTARIAVKAQGNTHIAYTTDGSWKTSLKEFPQWEKPQFNDSQWVAAKAYGALGKTLPWGDEVVAAGGEKGGRFRTQPNFKVEWVAGGPETGSLIAMTFNEFGDIIASRERGPLIAIRDKNQDKLPEKVEVYCEKMTNCQGILALNGKVFAVGEGPRGTGFYRLTDSDSDGRADVVDLLFKFDPDKMGEHGPHAPVLGPDGLVYLLVGNHAKVDKPYEPSSPHHHFYEGELNTPRYEDPGGHAVGIKAPGGTIVRTDTQGSFVELLAGGLRNPYDIAFNRQGELFTYDADMEWDEGLPWYRPTRVNHVVPGGDFGWRSGWVKWPDYFIDSLPSAVDTGRGSPTGMAAYNHFMYPIRYHDALFLGDWSRGRILAARLTPSGGSYAAETEVFVEGRPLNVTDLGVGPDGWLYFSTGGRGTEGGIYRVVWQGKVPPEITNLGTGIEAALRQPQLDSAFARQQIASIKRKMSREWNYQLLTLAENGAARTEQRLRALDLMQLFGPFPSKELLVRLSADRNEQIRAKATYLMGLHANDLTQRRLIELLDDADPMVQRLACESLVRAGQQAPPAKLINLLASPHRYVAWAARRALEQVPSEQWRDKVVQSDNHRAFLVGATGLMVVAPSKPTSQAIIVRGRAMMKGYMTDSDFVDLLRVFQLALLRVEIKPDEVADLRQQLAAEYPARDARINRELVRLLVYLQEPTAANGIIDQLTSLDVPMSEKLHAACYAHFLKTGWTTPQKMEMLKFLEHARTISGGHSLKGYIEFASRDYFIGLTDEERSAVLAEGTQWPSSALSVVAKLPANPGAETLMQLQRLDRRLEAVEGEAARKLEIGIVAVLARSGDPESMAYLREVFERDPERRVYVAMGLAQLPQGDNWEILVRALPVLDGAAAQEVLQKLASVQNKPDKPEPIRQVILRGIRLGDKGGKAAVELLEKWTGQRLSTPEDPAPAALARWQAWFAATYPDEPDPVLPAETGTNHWTYDELLSFLTKPDATESSPERGAAVFAKAQCSKCHRFGDEGEGLGPDLTTVTQRFQKKEILESVLYPSHVISDQYASKLIVTQDGKTYSGIVAPQGDEVVVLQPNGEKVTLTKEQIEATKPSKLSAMPDGLLNTLTLEEIADLFAYFNHPPRPSLSRRPVVEH